MSASTPDTWPFGILLAQTAKQWRKAIDRALEPHGLTEATWLPLLHLARAQGPVQQRDLAQRLALDHSTVVRLLDNFQSAGLIERHEGSTRRSRVIHLTEAGHAMVRKVDGIALNIRIQTLKSLSNDEIETAMTVLARIHNALSDEG